MVSMEEDLNLTRKKRVSKVSLGPKQTKLARDSRAVRKSSSRGSRPAQTHCR